MDLYSICLLAYIILLLVADIWRSVQLYRHRPAMRFYMGMLTASDGLTEKEWRALARP